MVVAPNRECKTSVSQLAGPRAGRAYSFHKKVRSPTSLTPDPKPMGSAAASSNSQGGLRRSLVQGQVRLSKTITTSDLQFCASTSAASNAGANSNSAVANSYVGANAHSSSAFCAPAPAYAVFFLYLLPSCYSACCSESDVFMCTPNG